MSWYHHLYYLMEVKTYTCLAKNAEGKLVAGVSVKSVHFLALIISYCMNATKFWLRTTSKENELAKPQGKRLTISYLALSHSG